MNEEKANKVNSTAMTDGVPLHDNYNKRCYIYKAICLMGATKKHLRRSFLLSSTYFSTSNIYNPMFILFFFIQVQFESKLEVTNESIRTEIELIVKDKDNSN
jgi:hypothetical protein